MNMFFLSLIVSVSALAMMMLLAYFVKDSGWQGVGNLLIGVLAIYFSRFSPVATIHLFVIVLLAIILRRSGSWSFPTFAISAGCLSVAIYGAVSMIAYFETEKYRSLREEYAQELLTERLPAVKYAVAKKTQTGPADNKLDVLESEISIASRGNQMRY